MTEKIVHTEEFGDITIRKNKRSKNVSIAIKPAKGIVVTLPYFLSYHYGIKIIEQKRSWIEKHLAKVKAIEKKKLIFDESSDFTTMFRKLRINKHQSDKVLAKISKETIHIQYPQDIDINTKELQEIIKKTIVKTLRLEAKDFLPRRTREISQKLGFNYNKVFIKNAKTLWGSCSGKNNINLNLHLMRLPIHLIDYVIIHELCHTVEKNHGPRFWKLMDSILGDAKKLSKELKQFSIQF